MRRSAKAAADSPRRAPIGAAELMAISMTGTSPPTTIIAVPGGHASAAYDSNPTSYVHWTSQTGQRYALRLVPAEMGGPGPRLQIVEGGQQGLHATEFTTTQMNDLLPYFVAFANGTYT